MFETPLSLALTAAGLVLLVVGSIVSRRAARAGRMPSNRDAVRTALAAAGIVLLGGALLLVSAWTAQDVSTVGKGTFTAMVAVVALVRVPGLYRMVRRGWQRDE